MCQRSSTGEGSRDRAIGQGIKRRGAGDRAVGDRSRSQGDGLGIEVDGVATKIQGTAGDSDRSGTEGRCIAHHKGTRVHDRAAGVGIGRCQGEGSATTLNDGGRTGDRSGDRTTIEVGKGVIGRDRSVGNLTGIDRKGLGIGIQSVTAEIEGTCAADAHKASAECSRGRGDYRTVVDGRSSREAVVSREDEGSGTPLGEGSRTAQIDCGDSRRGGGQRGEDRSRSIDRTVGQDTSTEEEVGSISTGRAEGAAAEVNRSIVHGKLGNTSEVTTRSQGQGSSSVIAENDATVGVLQATQGNGTRVSRGINTDRGIRHGGGNRGDLISRPGIDRTDRSDQRRSDIHDVGRGGIEGALKSPCIEDRGSLIGVSTIENKGAGTGFVKLAITGEGGVHGAGIESAESGVRCQNTTVHRSSIEDEDTCVDGRTLEVEHTTVDRGQSGTERRLGGDLEGSLGEDRSTGEGVITGQGQRTVTVDG